MREGDFSAQNNFTRPTDEFSHGDNLKKRNWMRRQMTDY